MRSILTSRKAGCHERPARVSKYPRASADRAHSGGRRDSSDLPNRVARHAANWNLVLRRPDCGCDSPVRFSERDAVAAAGYPRRGINIRPHRQITASNEWSSSLSDSASDSTSSTFLSPAALDSPRAQFSASPRRHINRDHAPRTARYQCVPAVERGLAAASCYIKHAITRARTSQLDQVGH